MPSAFTCAHCGKELSDADISAGIESINGAYESQRTCISCEWCEFPDGARFHSRAFCPRPGVTAHQVYAAGMRHVAECESATIADMVCAALNAITPEKLPNPES